MSEECPSRKKRRGLRACYILLVALVILVGGYGLLRWRLKSQLQRRVDAIRAAGYPVTCAELDKWYSIPDDVNNAADVILDALSHYRGPTKPGLIPYLGDAQMPRRAQALPAEMVDAIGQYLSENNHTLGLLATAATIKHARYPADFSAGWNAPLRHLAQVRIAAYLLHLSAIWHAEANDDWQAVMAVKSLCGVARSLAKEPGFPSVLVHLGCQGLSASTLEHILNRTELSDEQLKGLSQVINEEDSQAGLLRALVAVRCYDLDVFRGKMRFDPQVYGVSEGTAVLLKAYRTSGLSYKGATIYLGFVDEYLQACELPEHERISATKNIDAKLKKVPNIHAMAKIVMGGGYPSVVERSLDSTARLRIARVALAIERYRLATGKHPRRLAELVPAYLDAVPKDPFDGQELRYKRPETGYVVYSIGEDGSDNGGKERLPESKRTGGKENWDVTFIVER